MKETYISSYLRFPNSTRNYFSFLVSTKFIVDVRVEGEKIDDRPKSRMSKTSIKFPLAYSENEFVFFAERIFRKNFFV